MTGIRVSVCAANRRVDLTLPGSVPVADLVPDLARHLGLLDVAVAPALSTTAGVTFDDDRGLAEQGVLDGQLLHLTVADVPPPAVYDDLAEAVAELGGGTVTGPAPRLLGAALLTAAYTSLASAWSVPATVATLLTIAMGVLMLAGAAVPHLSLAAAGVRVPWPDESRPVDVEALTADLATADRILVTLTTTIALLPALVGPMAVRLGISAVALTVVSGMLVLVRSWRCRAQPAATQLGRLASCAETGCTLAIPPLLLLVSGLLERLPV